VGSGAGRCWETLDVDLSMPLVTARTFVAVTSYHRAVALPVTLWYLQIAFDAIVMLHFMMSFASKRTFEPLELSDLRGLCPYVDEETRRFCTDVALGKYSLYRERLLAAVLVQGAAQHFVDTRTDFKADNNVEVDRETIEEKSYFVTGDGRVISGVKDLDIVILFRGVSTVPIPAINHCLKAVYAVLPSLGERKLDLMKKSVEDHVTIGAEDAAGIVRSYVQKTRHGRLYLSQKSVIGLCPESIFGHPLWISRRWVQGRLVQSSRTTISADPYPAATKASPIK